MTDYQLRRIINAIESTPAGGFFLSLASAFRKADPINKQILLEAFEKMNGSDKYLPGGIHYEEITPEFGPSDLDVLQEHTMKYFGLTK